MEDLLDSILNSMSSVKKPQKKAMVIILTPLAYFQGRANFRNLSRFCSLCEETLGRWSLRSFSYQEFNRILLQRTQNLDSDWIASIDASFLPKSGKATEGLGYFYSGSQSKVQKGLEMSLLSVTDMKANTGFGLLAKQTLDQEFSDAMAGNRIDQAVDQIQDCKTELDMLGIQDLFYKASLQQTPGTARNVLLKEWSSLASTL